MHLANTSEVLGLEVQWETRQSVHPQGIEGEGEIEKRITIHEGLFTPHGTGQWAVEHTERAVPSKKGVLL